MTASRCSHKYLLTDISCHAQEAGYERLPHAKRLAATTPSGRAPTKATTRVPDDLSLTFPGPLVLPNDELALDPTYDPQSLRSWIREKERNKVTEERGTIYVASVPTVTTQVSAMHSWSQPKAPADRKLGAIYRPKTEDIVDYLRAFYHGMPVQIFSPNPRFIQWDGDRQNKTLRYVGLAIGETCVRIRSRPSPDGTFPRQLNLEDILDALIEALPEDAYAFLLLVDQDLYENDEDDFCCGRAYGGSRVAVVSSARYNPSLDLANEIDLDHVWPASHCEDHIAAVCGLSAQQKRAIVASRTSQMKTGPLVAAVNGAKLLASQPTGSAHWLARLVRTASHELGHCIAMDHCVYYACVMQGTAGLAEDVRQPPYLCPVCLSKLARAQKERHDKLDEEAYVEARYHELCKFCQRWENEPMFAGYKAWLETVLQQYALDRER